MLTFEQKLEIFNSFPELEQRNVSLGRVNFHYEGSVYDKKTSSTTCTPTGTGLFTPGCWTGMRPMPEDS